jgi:glutamyl-tRNA reductase
MRARKFRAIFLIDIAVPRDVESSAGDLDNVYLYDVDDLQHVVAANQEEREKEGQKAQGIVDQELARFSRWVDQADVVPTVVALRGHFDAIKNAEVERFLSKKLAHLEDKDKELVEVLARSLVNKLTHAPTVNLKRRASEGLGTQDTIDLVTDLFGLEETGANGHKPQAD